MTQVIAVLNQKGGVGKTTLTTHLGVALQAAGHKVLLVDSDPQGSLRDWNEANMGEVLPVIGLDRESLYQDLTAVKNGYDMVLIDGAPQSAKLAGAAVRSANMVLIPVTPSPYDVWACADLVEIVKTRQEMTDGLPQAYFVISRARKGTKLGAEVSEALQGYEIPCLASRTIHREVYARTAADGLTVYHQEKAIEAQEEITNLMTELLGLMEDGVQSKDHKQFA